MSELVIIAPHEMALPLRLAGVEVMSARNASEAFEHVLDLRASGGC